MAPCHGRALGGAPASAAGMMLALTSHFPCCRCAKFQARLGKRTEPQTFHTVPQTGKSQSGLAVLTPRRITRDYSAIQTSFGCSGEEKPTQNLISHEWLKTVNNNTVGGGLLFLAVYRHVLYTKQARFYSSLKFTSFDSLCTRKQIKGASIPPF